MLWIHPEQLSKIRKTKDPTTGQNLLNRKLLQPWSQVHCEDEDAIAGFIEVLKAKYHDEQEHMRVKRSYQEISLDMPEAGMCAIAMPMFITVVLREDKFGDVVTPASDTFIVINESSPVLDEAHRKRFHSKVA